MLRCLYVVKCIYILSQEINLVDCWIYLFALKSLAGMYSLHKKLSSLFLSLSFIILNSHFGLNISNYILAYIIEIFD